MLQFPLHDIIISIDWHIKIDHIPFARNHLNPHLNRRERERERDKIKQFFDENTMPTITKSQRITQMNGKMSHKKNHWLYSRRLDNIEQMTYIVLYVIKCKLTHWKHFRLNRPWIQQKQRDTGRKRERERNGMCSYHKIHKIFGFSNKFEFGEFYRFWKIKMKNK